MKGNEEAPNEKVKHLLFDHDAESHPEIFCEMQEIQRQDPHSDTGIWKEAARWIKFEETVEDGGDRWSKPHVATLSLHSCFELRVFLLEKGAVMLDLDVNNMTDLVDQVVDHMVNKTNQGIQNDANTIDLLKRQLLAGHEHQTADKSKGGFLGPSSSLVANQSHVSLEDQQKNPKSSKSNKFLRHIPKGAEAANILVGTMPCLQHPIMAFIRLKNSVVLPQVCEVDIKTKFVFILLGGPDFTNYYQIGRAFSTLMSDQIFHEVAYQAQTREDLLSGLDDFLDYTTVLPPGEWDSRIRIEPPEKLPNRTIKERLEAHPDDIEEDSPGEEHGADEALARTGVLFGGMLKDIKRKAPFFLSDFKDCMSLQCVSSYFFLYFAIITPVITFGGLWADATQNRIAAMESIFGAAISGFVYHLFSGQPLTIIGATGPILVFDTIVYQLCSTYNVPFLPFRLWIGIWTGLICIILVATDASFLVKYITRYTEESFSTLISMIFIIDGLKKIFGVNKQNTMWQHYNKADVTSDTCGCVAPEWGNSLIDNFNNTGGNAITMAQLQLAKNHNNAIYMTNLGITNGTKFIKSAFRDNGYPYLMKDQEDAMYCFYDSTKLPDVWPKGSYPSADDYSSYNLDQCRQNCGVLVGESCEYTRDVMLFSFMLSIGTFILATKLKGFKLTTYFPTKVRSIVSDFGVTAAIVIMVGLDYMVGINTPKLKVPSEFAPTLPNMRGWYIPPFGTEQEPFATSYALFAIIPAIPATILVFLDQQITAVIVNRRENKLKKGAGYHLDLFVVAIMIMVCSIFGLPWFVAATVLSITHVNSLKMESETAAPGEKAQFLGCREQRVTGLMIFLSIGLSVFAVDVLNNVPMPVLYGVFLYMGVSSLNGVQLVDRISLFFMPGKHQPDYVYLRHVPLGRVKLFTLIQISGLALLWIIKKSSGFSICFPLMVAAIIFIRKSFDWLNVFTQRELSWLDDVMPEEHKKKEKDASDPNDRPDYDPNLSPHSHKGHVHNKEDDINISKELGKSGAMKYISADIKLADESDALKRNETSAV